MYSDGMEPTRGQKIAGILIGDIFGIFLWFGISYLAFKYWGDENLSFAIAVAIGLPLFFLINIAYNEKPGYEKIQRSYFVHSLCSSLVSFSPAGLRTRI